MDGLIDGRIIKGVGGLYTVSAREGLYMCRPRGLFRNEGVTPLVGDEVTLRVTGGETPGPRAAGGGSGHIIRIHGRRNELLRPRVANVDQAVIVVAAKSPAINYDLLDRLILTFEHIAAKSGNGPEILICVNKTDLCAALEPEGLMEDYENIGYPVAYISALPEARDHGAGIEALRRRLAGKVSVLAGASGVGKSSAVNSLLLSERMPTGALSRKAGRGRHTTRHSELLELQPGGFIIDSPGFSSVSLDGIAAESLAGLFIEFRPFIGRCRFADCRHIGEPGCAVKAAAGGAVPTGRYDRYVSIYRQLKG